jgi:IS5 family transposase
VDATLIRADVSWESLVERHAEQVIAENPVRPDDPAAGPEAKKPGRPRTKEKAPKKISLTDPDATMTTSSKGFHLEPSYKQHTAVDDQAGVVVDVAVTTGEQNEGAQLLDQVERIETNTGRKVETITADAAYAHSVNYRELEKRGTEAIIPPQKESVPPGRMPLSRFKYDAKHRRVKCPGGKLLKPMGRTDQGTWYKAQAGDCVRCPLRARCFSATQKRRTMLIVDGYEALLRARRKRRRWSGRESEKYRRHRWRVEGIHGEAKTQHGLRRAARRGLWNVAIQAYLVAAVMNLKRLAALLLLVFLWGWRRLSRSKAAATIRTVPWLPACEIRAAIKKAA